MEGTIVNFKQSNGKPNVGTIKDKVLLSDGYSFATHKYIIEDEDSKYHIVNPKNLITKVY